jgi:hypothetical protein
VGLTLAWVVAAVLAVVVGVTAVTSLGDQIRDRGPIGDNELVRDLALGAEGGTLDPDEPRFEKTFTYDFGSFTVACQGRFAVSVGAPEPAPGWRTISYEQGPDDDIDAVFSDGRRSQEIEIYCDLGRPELGELEDDTLPNDD